MSKRDDSPECGGCGGGSPLWSRRTTVIIALILIFLGLLLYFAFPQLWDRIFHSSPGGTPFFPAPHGPI